MFSTLGRQLPIARRLLKQLSLKGGILLTGGKAFKFYGAFKIFGQQLHHDPYAKEQLMEQAVLNRSFYSRFLDGQLR